MPPPSRGPAELQPWAHPAPQLPALTWTTGTHTPANQGPRAEEPLAGSDSSRYRALFFQGTPDTQAGWAPSARPGAQLSSEAAVGTARPARCDRPLWFWRIQAASAASVPPRGCAEHRARKGGRQGCCSPARERGRAGWLRSDRRPRRKSTRGDGERRPPHARPRSFSVGGTTEVFPSPEPPGACSLLGGRGEVGKTCLFARCTSSFGR